ncbi:hypothetical protein [Paenibacillus pini]|uniref:RING-type domain-containing protein n=1 Tax=Paenibacillus pini JCM 16418 TaxID=1236976 RepID=W7YZ82_9BACL|nr:hypothetical protein [Paenibacillus pini]GAF09971.1 hypothetical protein JCM16418_4137 [Paenibacillus pini JCM 16418]
MQFFQLKDYIKESCAFLGIDVVTITEHLMRIKIPQHLKNEFSGVIEYEISFIKTSNPQQTYITFESFLTQKLAKLVAEQNHGVGHILLNYPIDLMMEEITKKFPNCEIGLESKELVEFDKLYVWCKTTVHGQLIEEYLKGFEANIETGSVNPLVEDLEQILLEGNTVSIDGLSREKLDLALSTVLNEASKDAERFVDKITRQTNKQLLHEIKRITDYYDTLIADNQAGETSKGNDPKTEIDLLVKEREALIHQQQLKFSMSENEVIIEPVAILVARNIVEHAAVRIHRNDGNTLLKIHGDNPINIHCPISDSTEGPFTITSDHAVVAEKHSFICTTCNKLFDERKLNGCMICTDPICPSCMTISSVSKKPLCNAHDINCPTCLQPCAEVEQHLCTNCNQFYCSNCNQGNLCPLCKSITPISSITPTLQRIIKAMPNSVKSKKFEYAEKGNRIALIGKGLLFKEFFVIYDKKEERIIVMQEFGMFNKKK